MNIHILRLKNGDDIICDMETDNELIYVNHPMIIWMENNNNTPKLCMDHWLPVQVIEDDYVTLNKSEVLVTMIPNSSLTEYYINAIEEMNLVLRAKEESDKMSDDEIIDTILALQEISESTIH